MTESGRRSFRLLAKACVPIGLIAMLVANVDLEHGFGRVRGLDRTDLAGAIYIGYLFNQILACAIGGDVARIWCANVALWGVLADRLAAILGMVVLAVLSWRSYIDVFGERPATLIAFVFGGR